jgi:hypothetical protein
MNQDKLRFVLCMLLVIFIAGCGLTKRVPDSGKITGIYNDKINNHDSMQLSCYIKDPESEKFYLHVFYPSEVIVIPDLLPGERVWLRCQEYRLEGRKFMGGILEIHKHPDKNQVPSPLQQLPRNDNKPENYSDYI